MADVTDQKKEKEKERKIKTLLLHVHSNTHHHERFCFKSSLEDRACKIFALINHYFIKLVLDGCLNL